MARNKSYGNTGLFDEYIEELTVKAFEKPLMRIADVIDWDIFVEPLKKAFCIKQQGPGGRPGFDVLLMFKILIIQKLHGLADDETSYQIADRCSFKVFLGMTPQDEIPDGQTIADFRNHLIRQERMDVLFDVFLSHIKTKHGLGLAKTGVIVDASFVDVPIARNTREQNEQIKAGSVPEELASVPQKDCDARWAKKNDETHFGYKNHVKVDAETKLILSSKVTTANVHDSQAMPDLVESGDKVVYADSAYTGQTIAEDLKGKRVEGKICEKGTRAGELTQAQKNRNKKKSKTRSRVEHVFGHMTVSMNALYQRCIGFVRNEGGIKLTNLVYNMARFEQIHRLGLA